MKRFSGFLVGLLVIFLFFSVFAFTQLMAVATPSIPKPAVGTNGTYSIYAGALPCIGSPKTIVFAVDFLNNTSGDGEALSISDIEKKFFAGMDETSPDAVYCENQSLRSFYYRSSYGKVDITGDVFAYTTKKTKEAYTDDHQLFAEIMEYAGEQLMVICIGILCFF